MSAGARIAGLDHVRGLAATMVMLQHCLEASGWATGALDPRHGLWNLGQAGVVAFFLVSGYVIPMSLERTERPLAFWISRAFRIYPMYLVAFVVAGLLLDGSFDAATMIAHLLFVQEFVPGVANQVPNSWTLSVELVWYIAASVLFAVGLLGRPAILFGMSLAGAILVGGLSWISPAIPVGRFCMLVSCVVGLLLFRHVGGRSDERLRIGALIGIVFALIAIAFRSEDGHPRNDFDIGTILTTWLIGYGVFFVGLAAGPQLAAAHVLSWLGRISFSVYLLHPFMISLAHAVGVEGIATVPVVFALTAAAATATCHGIERPAVRVGHRIAGRTGHAGRAVA